MRGRDVGHLATGEFPGEFVHPVLTEAFQNPGFVSKFLLKISGLKITFCLSASILPFGTQRLLNSSVNRERGIPLKRDPLAFATLAA